MVCRHALDYNSHPLTNLEFILLAYFVLNCTLITVQVICIIRTKIKAIRNKARFLWAKQQIKALQDNEGVYVVLPLLRQRKPAPSRETGN